MTARPAVDVTACQGPIAAHCRMVLQRRRPHVKWRS